MKFDIKIKECLDLKEEELSFYKSKFNKNVSNLEFKKVPVYTVFFTNIIEPYFFDHIYDYVYTNGECAKLGGIIDRNGKIDNIIISDKEDSYAIIAQYTFNNEQKTETLKLVYNPDTKW